MTDDKGDVGDRKCVGEVTTSVDMVHTKVLLFLTWAKQ